MPKKILLWAVVAFLIFYLVTQPQGSANIIKGVAGGLAGVARGLAQFVGNLS